MRSFRLGLGPLGRRLLLAFVLVAASSIVVLSVAALIGVGRGFNAAQEAERERVTASAAAAAGRAFEDAGSWESADLDRASVVAENAGARLFVLDATGSAAGGGAGRGNAGQNQNQNQGQGEGPAGGVGVFEAPVVVDGVTVGTTRLVFDAAASTGARDIAWSWIAAAAVVALVVAVGASWIVTRLLTRPIDAMTSAARAFAAGDRQVRTGARGPGELGDMARAFDSMADTVARSEQEQRNLTADVAHELRTPLAALQAGLEELRDGLVEPTPSGLAGLHDQSLRLGRVVSDLAELSAAGTSGPAVQRSEVDLCQIARDELVARDSQLRAAGLGVASRIEGPVVVSADPDRLHQAVGNLLANAARYCRPGDEVTVAVRVEGEHAVLDVADTGPGIPADELPRVFDRLWRGSAAEQVAGSGIGLAVAREIIHAHGGTIAAASPAGGGAVITIRLPVSPGAPRRT